MHEGSPGLAAVGWLYGIHQYHSHRYVLQHCHQSEPVDDHGEHWSLAGGDLESPAKKSDSRMLLRVFGLLGILVLHMEIRNFPWRWRRSEMRSTPRSDCGILLRLLFVFDWAELLHVGFGQFLFLVVLEELDLLQASLLFGALSNLLQLLNLCGQVGCLQGQPT